MAPDVSHRSKRRCLNSEYALSSLTTYSNSFLRAPPSRVADTTDDWSHVADDGRASQTESLPGFISAARRKASASVSGSPADPSPHERVIRARTWPPIDFNALSPLERTGPISRPRKGSDRPRTTPYSIQRWLGDTECPHGDSTTLADADTTTMNGLGPAADQHQHYKKAWDMEALAGIGTWCGDGTRE